VNRATAWSCGTSTIVRATTCVPIESPSTMTSPSAACEMGAHPGVYVTPSIESCHAQDAWPAAASPSPVTSTGEHSSLVLLAGIAPTAARRSMPA
jgi:hypothetical protein